MKDWDRLSDSVFRSSVFPILDKKPIGKKVAGEVLDNNSIDAKPKDEQGEDKKPILIPEGSSKQKFEALQAYLQESGQGDNPVAKSVIAFLKETLADQELGQEAKEVSEHLLNSLFLIPVKHAEKVDELRSKLSINRQEKFAPIPPPRKPRYDYTRKKLILMPEIIEEKRGEAITFTKLDIKTIQGLNGELEFAISADTELHPEGIKADKQTDALIDPEHPLIQSKLNKVLESDYLADYGVKWDETKCIRDLYQNFLDSHGQTLEGVNIRVSRKSDEDGTYIIRIEGLGEFNPEYVEKTGATTKKDNQNTAGGFGEGAKILSLVLLRDHKVSNIAFSSRNWRMDYHLGPFVSGKLGLFRKLQEVNDRRGNYVEITTDSAELVHNLIKGVDLCYHPYNPDFQNPDYENEIGGFKYLGQEEKGNVYIAGQRYEVYCGWSSKEAKWDKEFDQFNTWLNKKSDFGSNRDRPAISEDDAVRALLSVVSKMSDEDIIRNIKLLKKLWFDAGPCKDRMFDKPNYYGIAGGTGGALLSTLIRQAEDRGLITQFPEDYLAFPQQEIPCEFLNGLSSQGYIFCHAALGKIGMKSAEDFFVEKSKHEGFSLTKEEIIQINILKETVKLLGERHFSSLFLYDARDTAKDVYVFDRLKEKGNKNVNAQYEGSHLWIDRTFLKESTFEKALAVYIHEITHKHGDDGRPKFSYKLTDWLDIAMRGFNDDELRGKLNALKSLWLDVVPSEKAELLELKQQERVLWESIQALSGRAFDKIIFQDKLKDLS